MSPASQVVTHQALVELIGPHGPVPAEVELRYDPADPYAVSVVFLLGSGEVAWLFGRELLIRGLAEPAGEGDVAVSPSLDPDGRAVVVLVLRSRTGEAVVQLSARDVLRFLAATTRSVWPGTESDHLRADDEIAALLVGD